MDDTIFKANPHLEHVYKTADGEAFYTEPDAMLHAKSLKDKKVEKVQNPDKGLTAATETGNEPKQELKKLTAEEAIAAIQAATTPAELEPFGKDTRATVKKALEAKTKELQEKGSEGADPDNGEQNQE